MSQNLPAAKLEAARKLVEEGNPVLPIVPGTKVPPKGFQLAESWKRTPAEAELKDWFLRDNMDLAMATGIHRAVVDVDGAKGEASLKELGGVPLTYQVKTRSDGRHYHFSGSPEELAKIPSRNGVRPGLDIKCRGGYVLVPPTPGYEPVTDPADLAPLAALQGRSLNLLFLHSLGVCGDPREDAPAVTLDFSQGHRDDTLYHTAVCLRRGGMARGDAEKLIEILAKSCSPPFPPREALKKIKSAYGQELPAERNLTAAVREWVLSTNGVFASTDVDKDLGLSTRVDKGTRSKILSRLAEDGLIERWGEKNGVFRRLEKNCNFIEWESADVKNTFPIYWPFELERFVTIYPKNVVVVAGDQNAGKTAFLLNVVQKNLVQYDGRIHYFSSEMGPEELRLRIDKFGLPDKFWRGARFWDRSTRFADVIVPDAINIIDFLEVSDKFYAAGGEIREIFDKLHKGIAIIAIQKAAGKELGRGAEFALEKPRLYLSMDHNRLKIMKAKNWATKGQNPNGMTFDFKLVEGCRFIQTGGSGT
ncbi:MAG: bifunctional DNA primase/polymerase [Acidobacteriota bacterium]